MRYFLLPISWIFRSVVYFRNQLFDRNFIAAQGYKNSIGVGNLSMGGTGKSPLTIYIAEIILKNKGEPALLSRGYGRKTKGFIEVTEQSTSNEVGDEPLMFKQRFSSNAGVYVCEDRNIGSNSIRDKRPESTLIYDDVFQHRKTKPSFTIVTTPFSDPFFEDKILPVGRLREPINNIKRADCILVTKCPEHASKERKVQFSKKLERFGKPVFYSEIRYGSMVPLGRVVKEVKKILLVTGIADPSPLINNLQASYEIESISFPDHHTFTHGNLNKIHEKFGTFDPKESIILTTEKDKARLSNFKDVVSNEDSPWYYQPMSIHIHDEVKFQSLIEEHVRKI